MRKYQNLLLTGVAVFALAMGTGFVAAQTMNHSGTSGAGTMNHSGTSGAGTSGPATESHGDAHTMKGMGQGSNDAGAGVHAQGRGGAGTSAQNPAGTGAQTRGQAGAQRRGQAGAQTHGQAGAQTHGQTQTGAQNRNTQNGSATNGANRGSNENSALERGRRGRHRNEQQNTVQGQRGLRGQPGNEQKNTLEGQRGTRGLQGNASGQMHGSQRVETSSGRSVQLSQDQRTKLRQTIIESGNAPRVGRVNFDVRAGTVIPRSEFTSIRVVPVPRYLVQIEPRWRGHEYFVYQDKIVIVEPRDLRIIAIVPA